MDPDEFERAKAELLAECQRIGEPFMFGPLDRSAVLDHAREECEAMFGQPCVAQWAGDEIRISTPVIDRSRVA